MKTITTLNLFTLTATIVCSLIGFTATASAQMALPFMTEEVNDELAESGASLKTDPDLEALMVKAERYRKDGNYRVATKLWQAVLERSGDSLYTKDGQRYFSLVEGVEKTISQLPEEGLSAYRVTADAEAREILNGVSRTDKSQLKTALSSVIRQYFISSLGDDAAYELGSIYLDHYDFTGALRLFEKIASTYPDPSVPLDQVYLRIALCHSWLGDAKAAEVALKKSAEVASATVENLDAVSASLGKLTVDTLTSQGLAVWETRLGNATRDGVMPAPPAKLMEQDLVAVWQYYTEPKDIRYDRLDHVGFVRTGAEAFSEDTSKTVSGRERNLITAWREKAWRPVGQLLFDDDQIFFRSPADVIAFDKSAIDKTIAASWNGKKETPEGTSISEQEKAAVKSVVSWRSAWRNSFEIDESTRMKEAVKRSWGGRRASRGKTISHPVSMSEVQFFGDRIASQLSICGEYLFALEGPSYDEKNRHSTARVNVQWNSSFPRSRTNFLTAYDRDTGLILWRLPKENPAAANTDAAEAPEIGEDNQEFVSGGGFMAAPIRYGDMVLVPVNFGGAISVYALDPKNDGKTIWSSFLCDEPETSAQPWSAIQMSISGSDLFVNCGMGAVFILDPATGMVRFAERYERAGVEDNLMRRHGWHSKRKNFDGWQTDDIIAYRNQLIYFASDKDVITAVDRNSGETIWECEYNPVGSKVDYLIGVYNDILYAGGSETIIAYDLKGQGRMLWGATQIFKDKKSYGRAMLTPGGVFVPVDSAILQFPLTAKNSGQEVNPIASVEVNLGTGAPLGSLYCDGQRIYVQGGNRLYALGIAPDRTGEEAD